MADACISKRCFEPPYAAFGSVCALGPPPDLHPATSLPELCCVRQLQPATGRTPFSGDSVGGCLLHAPSYPKQWQGADIVCAQVPSRTERRFPTLTYGGLVGRHPILQSALVGKPSKWQHVLCKVSSKAGHCTEGRHGSEASMTS